MEFLQMWPLVFLIFIPLVILMYILKQKAEDYVYSSTFLWEEVFKNYEVNTPWEKLKRNLLLYIQLFLILLFIGALMHPFIFAKNQNSSHVVIVLDNSGSMNTMLDSNITRFDQAKEDIKGYIRSLKEDTSISIITTAQISKLEIGHTTNQELALEKVNDIKSTDMVSKVGDTFSLIQALTDQWEDDSYEVVFYTDQLIELNNMKGQVNAYYNEMANMSLDYVSHTLSHNRLDVMVRVTNRSDYPMASDINLYGDNVLLDIYAVELNPKESQLIYFDDVNFQGNILKAEINEADALSNDNVAYDVLSQLEQGKVLLVTDRNVFLEKALQTISNIEIFKTNDMDLVSENEQYDLYIFDNVTPEYLPQSGNIFFINPTTTSIFSVGDVIEGGKIFGTSDSFNYLDQINFSVRERKELQLPNWANNIFTVDEESAGFYGMYNGQKIAVLSFQLHHSDLVLKPDFPILIHELLSGLIDTGLIKNNKVLSGEAVSFNTITEGSALTVIHPNEREEDIPLRFPMKDYTNTDQTGVYQVQQTVNNELKEALFVVNFPTEQESYADTFILEGASNTLEKNTPRGRLDLKNYLILAILLVLLLEWIVYIKKY